jgi:hypothetical protein
MQRRRVVTDRWVVGNRSALRAVTSAVIIVGALGTLAVVVALVVGGFSWLVVRAGVVGAAVGLAGLVVRAVVEYSLDRYAAERVRSGGAR